MGHRVIREIENICKRYSNIDKVVLFGSRARGDNRERSDFDVAIYMQGEYTKILDEIDNINTLLKIDITIIKPENSLSEQFLDNVKKEGITIYEQVSE